MLGVRRMTARDVPAVVAIVEALPDYFTKDTAGQAGRDSASHDGWVLADAAEIAGFTVA